MTTVRLNDSDSGHLVAVQLGDELLMELEDLSSAGYSWTVDPQSDGTVRLRSINIVPPANPMWGASGTCKVRFETAAVGTTELHLKLWRDWVGDASIAKRVTVPVEVRAPRN